MRFFDVVVILVLLAIIAVGGWFIYDNLPGEKKNYDINLPENTPIEVPNYDGEQSKQFYPNMRFPDKRISYGIESACGSDRIMEISEALDTLQQRTVLEFYRVSSGEQIIFTCSDLAPEPSEQGHFVAGEGGPSKIVNSSTYSVILEGKVALYREEKCDEPKIALHEMLHVLGYDHNDNRNSLLYPTLDCKQEIDDYLIDDINRLYSQESLPDLAIVQVSGSISARYLSFELEVANQGLADVSTTSVSIYAEGEFVKKFEFEDVEIGVKKILSVENLRVPRYAEEIRFVVDQENKINEIDENNNIAELNL